MTDTVKIAMIKTKVKPCDRWSFTNKILMLIQGTADARGYRQWQEAGRHVKKGAHAIHILAPRLVTVTQYECGRWDLNPRTPKR